MRILTTLLFTPIFLLASMSPAKSMEDVKTYVEESCGTCHALKKISKDIQERIKRKGSHLYYAGNKYQRKWLEAWLQKTTLIRPSGEFPLNHTEVTDEGDVIKGDTLLKHIDLPSVRAKEVTDYLMSLTPNNNLIENVSYTPKKISLSMGKMNFGKFKGCQSCHRDKANEGGQSGPELYTAWNRLQPEYLISYTKDPNLWDVNTMMPNRHLKDSSLQKLVDYLKVIGEKNANL